MVEYEHMCRRDTATQNHPHTSLNGKMLERNTTGLNFLNLTKSFV